MNGDKGTQLKRIGVFYDGNYFHHVSNFYAYYHPRQCRISISGLHEFIRAQGFERSGKHHEIYLSDPRRTPAEKLKTILRVPVRKAGKTQAAEA